MGEVKIKSGNLVESYVADNNKNRYIAVLYAEADLKPNTTYTIALTINEGYDVYFNEKVFSNWSAFTGDGTYQVFALTTRSDLTKNNNTYTSGKGWWILKNNKYQANFINVSDFQILEGTYTLETIPEYEPYFLNRPAHRYTNGQWVDIPTHHYTNNRWQGELTSQSPLKFRADGEMLDWRVEGRTSGNLLDFNALENAPMGTLGTVSTCPHVLELQLKPSTAYTMASNGTGNETAMPASSYRSVYFADSVSPNAAFVNHPVTVTTDLSGVIKVGFFSDRTNAQQYLNGTAHLWLIEGSTALPYEPYGGVGDWDEEAQRYKIPVRVEGENLFDINGEHISNSRLGIDCFVVDDNKLVVQIISPGGTTRISYPNNFYNPNVYTVSVKLTGELTGIRLLSTSPFPGGTYNTTYRAYWKAMTLNGGIYTTTFSPTETTTIGFVVMGADDARNPGTVENIRLYEGTYTASTIPPYEVNLYTDHQLMDGDSIDYATDQTVLSLATGNNTLAIDTAVKPSKVFIKFEG